MKREIGSMTFITGETRKCKIALALNLINNIPNKDKTTVDILNLEETIQHRYIEENLYGVRTARLISGRYKNQDDLLDMLYDIFDKMNRTENKIVVIDSFNIFKSFIKDCDYVERQILLNDMLEKLKSMTVIKNIKFIFINHESRKILHVKSNFNDDMYMNKYLFTDIYSLKNDPINSIVKIELSKSRHNPMPINLEYDMANNKLKEA